MAKLDCPDRQRIQEFLLGLVDGPDAEQLELHLGQCVTCGQTLAEVAGRDTLTDALRNAAPRPAHEAVEIVRLKERLRNMSSAGENSAVPVGEDSLSLLGPSERPGEIGRLGGYRVLRVIGAGGMGVVFEAEDEQLRRLVALKVIRPALAREPIARKRFLREARAAAALDNEHIVTVHQVGQEGNVIFLAMQRLEGESLADRLKHEGTLPVAEAVRIAREIAVGLAAAHEQRLVHRDIKPDNLWLDKRGHVKILDFGLARLHDEIQSANSCHMLVGTPNYMAPEQARGEQVTGRYDLYSLGAVLYRMLTGRPPVEGNTVTAIVLSLANDEPPAVKSLRPEVPAELDDVIRNLLAKDPSQRPASAEAVVQLLKRIEQQASQPQRSAVQPTARSFPRWLLGAALLALGIITYGFFVRVSTDHGDIVIDTAGDPDVTLVLEKGLVRIRDLKNDRTYDLKVAQRPLPTGEYELDVAEAGGLAFQTRQFRIDRGKTTRLKAWLDPNSPPGSAGPPSPAAQPTTRLVIVKIPATRQWTATGVRLRNVAELTIAASGIVQASGEERIYYHDVPPEGRAERLPHFPYAALPGLALLGRIGDGPAFYVGKEWQTHLTAKQIDDELMLGINDDIVSDNSGEWTVQITTRQP